MRHIGQAWKWGAMMLGAAAFGCSESGPEQVASNPSGDGMADDGSDTALEFSIDGRQEPLGAQARLEVREGIEPVHLAISGADRASDYVLIDLQFATIEATMGVHDIELGLPDRVENHATVSLGGEPYYSQGGRIEVSLSEDGAIAGTFDLALARHDTQAGVPAMELLPSDDAMPLTGEFSGKWVLSCHSRLAGHSALVSGGEFCDNLEF